MSDTKPQFWVMRHSDDVMERAHHLSVECSPPRLLIRNADEFVDYLENDWNTSVHDPVTSRRSLSPPPPPIELQVTQPDFAPDLFIHETSFVSAALRHAMALLPDDAQWFPVDSRWSTPDVQAKRYSMLHATCVADPIDYERSEGVWLDTASP